MYSIISLLLLSPLFHPLSTYLHSDQQSDFEQHALELPDGDVVDGSGAKLAVEEFRPEVLEVGDGEGPEMEDVVARESVALLDDNGFGAEEGGLDGGPKAARAAACKSDINYDRARL